AKRWKDRAFPHGRRRSRQRSVGSPSAGKAEPFRTAGGGAARECPNSRGGPAVPQHRVTAAPASLFIFPYIEDNYLKPVWRLHGWFDAACKKSRRVISSLSGKLMMYILFH